MPPVRSLRMSPNRFDPDDHVEGVRPAHELQRGGIDVQLLDGHVRESGREPGEHAVPQHVGKPLRVRLGDHGKPPAARAGQLEREAQDALDAPARVHGRLDGDLVRRAAREDAARVHVFAFGILAHDDEVDGVVGAQRAGHAREGARGADARVEVEGLAHPDERGERDVIRQP